MNQKKIKNFFYKLNNLNLSKDQKKRMLKFIQVRINNKVNKVFTYNDLKLLFSNNTVDIAHLVTGPCWNRLVFMDVKVKNYEQ